MAYQLPTFNQECNIFNPATGGQPAETLLGVPCQVKGVPRLYSPGISEGDGVFLSVNVMLKLPAKIRVFADGTDPVGSILTVQSDPPVRYRAKSVYDVAQGFDNEYRVALCIRLDPLPTDVFG